MLLPSALTCQIIGRDPVARVALAVGLDLCRDAQDAGRGVARALAGHGFIGIDMRREFGPKQYALAEFARDWFGVPQPRPESHVQWWAMCGVRIQDAQNLL